MRTVRQLIEELSQYNPDAIVICGQDHDWNYTCDRPFVVGKFFHESGGCGNFWLPEDIDDEDWADDCLPAVHINYDPYY